MTKDLVKTNFLTRVSNSFPVKYAKHASIALITGAALALAPVPDGVASYLGLSAEASYVIGQGAGIWAAYPALSSEEVAYCSDLADKIASGEIDSALHPYIYSHEELPSARDLFEGDY